MSERFDPYYTWLGIPPEEQPANHYRMLGVKPFEENAEVISHAADQRMAHLKSLQGGKNAAVSQRVLNELSAAAVCLLDPEKKRAYDQMLRSQPPAGTPPLAAPHESLPAFSTTTRRSAGRSGPLVFILAGIGVAVAIALIPVALWLFKMRPPQLAEAPISQDGSGTSEPTSEPAPPGPPGTPVAPKSPPAPVASTSIMPPDTTAPASPMPTSPATVPPMPEPPAAVETPMPAPSTPLPSAAEVPRVETVPAETPPAVTSPAPAPPVTAAEPRPPRSLADLVDQPDTGSDPSPDANRGAETKAAELPPAEALDKARAQVIDILGEEAKQAAKPEQKTALARKMLGLAKESAGDKAAQYVLLDNARKLFIGAGDVRQAMQAVATMSKHFKLDEDGLESSTFTALADANLTPEARDQLAETLLQSLDAALDEQKFSIAESYSLLATKVASRTKDVELRKNVAERRTELQRLKAQLKEVEAARAVLAANANDAAANLVVGKFLCFELGEWEQGGEHFIKSGEPVYVSAAEADARAAKGDNKAALEAAEVWYKLAETIKKDDKDAAAGASERAKELYEQALPSLTGLEKIRVEKRLEEFKTAQAAPDSGRPKRTPRRKFFPGLVGREFAKHERQADGNLYTGWVPPEELGEPIGPPALIGSLAPLKYSRERNCIASGYLKIDTPGEYAFNANADYDRCALYIDGKLICPFRDGEAKVARIKLEKGMTPIQVVSMVVYSHQCTIKWQPPGATDLGPIPPTVMFHTRN